MHESFCSARCSAIIGEASALRATRRYRKFLTQFSLEQFPLGLASVKLAATGGVVYHSRIKWVVQLAPAVPSKRTVDLKPANKACDDEKEHNK